MNFMSCIELSEEKKYIDDEYKEIEKKHLDIMNDDRTHSLIKSMSEVVFERAKSIKEKSNVDSFNLVFVGKVGIGKTSLISIVLGLYRKQNIIGKKKKELFLLPTASGRTTVCEMEFLLNQNTTKIHITPMCENDMKKDLDNYVDFLLKSCDDDNKIPEEMQRIFRNMIGLSKDEIKKQINEMVTKEQLLDEFLNKINYAERNKCEILFDEDGIEKEFEEILKEINFGKNKECPIPEKLTIYLKSSDFDVDIPCYINKIVDTKGLDNDARQDIKELIEKPENIIIFCDEINDIGNSDNHLCKILIREVESNYDFKKRALLIGMEKNFELENVADCNSRDAGVEHKKSEAKDGLNRIKFTDENIQFYNCLDGIDWNNKNEISNCDYKKIDTNITLFWSYIDNLVRRMYDMGVEEEDSFKLDIVNNNKVVSRLKNGKPDKELISVINDLKEQFIKFKIEYCSNGRKNNELMILKNELQNIHHMQIKATVPRHGHYYNANVYEIMSNAAKAVYIDAIDNKYYNSFETAIELNFKKISDGDLNLACKNTILQKVMQVKEKYNNLKGKLWKENLLSTIQNDGIWSELCEIRGSGYKEKVINNFCNRVDLKKIDQLIDYDYQEKFFIDLIDFMEFK